MKKDKKTAEKNRDITEHKRAEETLSVSEVRYRRLFETARDGILILDAETGMVVDVNPFLIEMLGYSHEQFMGKTVWELGFLKDVVANRDMFAELQRREYIRYEDLPLETSDGRRIAVEFISNVYLINHKKVIQCNIRDITERKRVEEELQRSEQSFKSISENAHDGIIVALRNGARIYANRRASEITGYSINEILKTGMEGLAHPDEILKLSERRKKILAGENVPNQYDTVIIHKDGNAVPIEITSARTLWYGQVADIFVFRDITERKRAEEALKKSEEYFKEITENASDIIIITDKNGDIKYCSRSVERFTGYKPEELVGRSAFTFINPDDVKRSVSAFGKAVLTKDAVSNAFRIVHKDGSERYFDGLGKNLLDNPAVAGFIMNIRDLTERKQAEKALQESEEKYRTLFETMAQGVVYQTADRKIASANPAAERILGLALDQMQGQPSVNQRWKVIHEDGSDFSRGTYPSAVALKSGREVLNVVIGILNPENNSLRWINVNAIPQFKPGENKPYQVYTTFEDITERKRAQEALRESEGRYKALFSEALDGICLADAETGKIIDCNEAMAVMVGRDKAELIGQHQAILHPSTGDKVSLSPTFRQHLADKAGQVLETQVVSKTGEIREVEIKANIMDLRGVKMLQGMFRDITERKRAEKALRESEENFHRSLADSPLGIRIINADGKILYANQAILDIYGYDSIKELKTTPHKKNYTPESYTEHQVRKEKRQRGEYVPSNYEISIIRKDGEIRYLEVFRKEVLWNDEKQFQVLYNDITERKRAEEALRESEERFRIATETTNDVVYEWDLQHTVQWFGNIDELLGYGPGKFPRTIDAWTDSIHPEDRERVMAAVQAKLDGRAPYAIEYRVRRQDGVNRWWSARGDIVKTLDGNPIKWIGTVTDITERKRAEEELRDSEEKLRIIFESIGDGIIVTNLEGIIIQTNEAAAKLGGWSDKSKLIGMSGFDFVADKEQSKLVTDMIRALKQQHSINVEYSVKAKNGREYQSEVSITLLRDASGSPNGIVSVIRDITERKRVEEALRESEKKYRLLAENASDVITVMDMNMRPIYMSPSITRLLGYSVEEAMARGIENGLTPKSLKVATKGLAKTIAAELKKKKLKPVTVDFELTRKDGSTVWVAASVALIRGSDGQPTEILSILHDISERKKAEEALLSYKDHLEELVEERTTELDKAKLIAEEASKAKSEFLANMSHEIRTPLSSIIGFSELLADEVNGLLNNDQKKYLGYVTSSGQHLLSLINDILDLSKVEAGKMELQPTSFSISDLLKNSSSFIAEEAMKHNIRLLSEIPADVDVIEADERKVKQIIYNLLSNAVKFTPDGGSITTKADIVSPDSAALPIKIRKGLPDTEYVLVSVKDTGIGIAKKDQSKLFTEFHQIENPYTKKYEGTGLGLALSRKLVTLHGGRIWFESKGKGKGCTFYFILPLIILPNA